MLEATIKELIFGVVVEIVVVGKDVGATYMSLLLLWVTGNVVIWNHM